MATTAEIKYVLQCGNAKSVPPDDDSDPVLLTRIVAIANGETRNGEIYIRHFVASGENYTRNKNALDGCFGTRTRRWWHELLSVKGRVARALLSLAEAFGHDVGQDRIVIRQKVSQSDLAAMAGVARENVSRVLNDWTSHSLLTRLAGYYCVENRSALRRETEE